MKHDELIALYFENRLNQAQQAEFNDLLKTNTAFKAQFELEQAVKTAIISIKKDQLKQKLHQLEQPKKRKKFHVLSIAASILITLGLFGLWWQNRPVDHNQLFAAYFKPYTNVIAPSERGHTDSDAKAEAFRNYDAGNYMVASKKFEHLYNATSTSYYLFYQAMCELELGNIQKGIRLLEQHKTLNDRFLQYTNWYLALSYLKNNNTNLAVKTLKHIVDKQTYNNKNAKKLLAKID